MQTLQWLPKVCETLLANPFISSQYIVEWPRYDFEAVQTYLRYTFSYFETGIKGWHSPSTSISHFDRTPPQIMANVSSCEETASHDVRIWKCPLVRSLGLIPPKYGHSIKNLFMRTIIEVLNIFLLIVSIWYGTLSTKDKNS